jgi:hypothetical protein
MAAHESPRTTKLYDHDHTGDEITLDEVDGSLSDGIRRTETSASGRADKDDGMSFLV